MWAKLKAGVSNFTGKEEYSFGDLTASVLQKGKGAIHAFTGKEEYVFGDVTRTIVRKSGRQLEDVFLRHRMNAIAADNSNDTTVIQYAQVHHTGAAAPEEAADISMDDLWGSFFSQSELVCLEALRDGLLSPDAVHELDPFLFIGLPGLTLLEAVLRSRGNVGLEMSTGLVVTASNVPAEVAGLYRALDTCKLAMEPFDLTQHDCEFLRYAVLFAETDGLGVEPTRPDDERKVALRSQIVATVRSVATQVTQLSFYKANFLDVLESATERSEACQGESDL
eukprot:TRINITY_DN22932_c0_g1_i2.p1 TRINITY_DN22932_c0_g1~~TRINITY_DN22932_c0_g1_i2.p1  ORF type:complete len:280 (-),score=59.51 TRINITY_DN22932_c0_g1_i2:251-1090(-)